MQCFRSFHTAERTLEDVEAMWLYDTPGRTKVKVVVCDRAHASRRRRRAPTASRLDVQGAQGYLVDVAD